MPATALEQMILELVNRARLDPAAEAARYGIALNEGVPAGDTISTASKQPLAMNETLLGTARAHSQDMIDRDYFAHDTPEGVTPFQRIVNAGYNYSTAGENIALVTSSGAITNQMTVDLHQLLFVDLNYPGRGHRVNILLGDYQEIGVGQAAGNYQGSNGSALTEDFGTRGNQQFLTGVSYADSDHNNFYSIGEGRGSMSVVAGGSTSTGTAGGYSLAVNSGLQTVTFSNGGLASPINLSVSIAAHTNAKVDVIDQGTVATSASLTDLGGATTIIALGTFGLALTGDSGNDKFVVGKGNDTIDGAGGSDTVVFSGNFSAYSRTTLGNGSIQVAGPDGTDTVRNVEVLQFADQSVAVGAVAGSIVISDQTLSEGDNGTKVMTFTVTRSGGTAAFDVNFATANGSATVADGDYVASAGTLHFGDSVNTQTISVTINGDLKVEPGETFSVTLSAATNGAAINDGQGVGTIANDDVWEHTRITDFNADARTDLLFVNNTSHGLAQWQLDGTQIASAAQFGTVNAAAGWHYSDRADFNGDGKTDLFFLNDTTHGAAIWQMNGTQVVSAAQVGTINDAAGWHYTTQADFDGDGKSDLLFLNDTNHGVAVWQMNGTQVASAAQVGTINAAAGWAWRDVGDFNGDGKTDLLFLNDTTHGVAIWQMNGTQVAAAAQVGTITDGWHFADTGDFNGDGKTDLFFLNDTTHGTAIWQMNGTQVASAAPVGTITDGWHFADTADFGGDGKTDLLFFNDTTHGVAVWQMNGTQIASAAPVGTINAGAGWSYSGLVDSNGDGKTDLLFENSASHGLAVWEMNGTQILAAAQIGTVNAAADWHLIP